MQNVTVTLYGVEKRRIPTKKMDFQHTLKEKEKKERELLFINANAKIKRERENNKKRRKSAMLQFRLVNTLEKHATSTDYHCGLYQSENAEA